MKVFSLYKFVLELSVYRITFKSIPSINQYQEIRISFLAKRNNHWSMTGLKLVPWHAILGVQVWHVNQSTALLLLAGICSTHKKKHDRSESLRLKLKLQKLAELKAIWTFKIARKKQRSNTYFYKKYSIVTPGTLYPHLSGWEMTLYTILSNCPSTIYHVKGLFTEFTMI